MKLKGFKIPDLGHGRRDRTSLEQLDLATAIKVSRALSGEVVLGKLIDTLMRTAIEYAGAERALLILPRGDEQRIEAEATTNGDTIIVRREQAAGSAWPESIVHYVMRTQECVILDDAVSHSRFSGDTYIDQRNARSILCLPLVREAKLISVLYLENNLAPHVFTSTRIAVLKLLACQAAISMENTRLYAHIEEREARFRRLVDANIIGIVSWNLEGEILEANDAFLSMMGYDRDDLLSGHMRWADLIPAEWQERAAHATAELKGTGNVQTYEMEFFRKDRSRVPVLVGRASFEAGGNKGVTFVLDLSEQKRSQEHYRIVVDTSSDAVIAADERGFIMFTNPATKRIFGYDSAELVGRPLTMLMPKSIRELHEAGFERYLATGQRHIDWQGTELIGMRKNGEAFPLEISFGEQVRNGHRVFVGSVRDISDKKRTEEAFRHLVVGTAATTGSDFFQSLVQHMAQALRARYAFVSTCDDRKHARTLAFWKGDGLGQNFEFDISDTPCEKVLNGEVCSYRQELRILFPRDKILADLKAESYLGLPMVDGSNRVIGHIAILDDKPMDVDLRAIDLLKIFASRAAAELKRQKAEDELQAAVQERERMREELAHLAHLNRVSTMGELAASLAHEIKQPISAAMIDARTCSRWLNRDCPDVQEAQAAASRVVKDVARASEIISRVRSLFKKDSLRHEEVDINELIQEIIALLRSEASRHSILIHSDFSFDLPPIMADRVQLQQVFMNLMLNGIEAMKDMNVPGKLTVRSQQDDCGQLLITVMDTGIGIPSERMGQIFNAFFTSKPQGTGMGLTISRSIIESHGGRLWAVSNPESGTTFQFTLPIQRTAHSCVAVPSSIILQSEMS